MADFKTQFLLPRRRLGRERKPLSNSSITLYIANLNKLTQLLGCRIYKPTRNQRIY